MILTELERVPSSYLWVYLRKKHSSVNCSIYGLEPKVLGAVGQATQDYLQQ